MEGEYLLASLRRRFRFSSKYTASKCKVEEMAGNPRHFETRAMSLLPPSYFVHKPPPREDAEQEAKEDAGNAEGQALKVENDRLR